MPGISDVQKLIDVITAEIAGKEQEIQSLFLTRKRLEDGEEERKTRAAKAKADKPAPKTDP